MSKEQTNAITLETVEQLKAAGFPQTPCDRFYNEHGVLCDAYDRTHVAVGCEAPNSDEIDADRERRWPGRGVAFTKAGEEIRKLRDCGGWFYHVLTARTAEKDREQPASGYDTLRDAQAALYCMWAMEGQSDE